MKARTRKKLILFGIVCSLLIILGFLLYPGEVPDSEYIFDQSYNIQLEDVKRARRSLPTLDVEGRSDDTQADPTTDVQSETTARLDIAAIFSEGLINSHTTLKYFKHLEHRFRKSSTLGEHFENVRQYLNEQFPAEEANILFDTYRQYLQCEMDLLNEYRNFSGAKSAEEAIEVLKRIHDFRRERLGTELADRLFGADVKAKEYAFHRAAIISDENLYGAEKEKRIRRLNADMWGEEADAVEAHPNAYNRYREKINIYQKDLSEMPSDAMRQAKIKTFREDFFDPETVKALEAVDAQLAEKKAQESAYRKKESDILADSTLSDAEKKNRIETLQNETFGDGADAFRRREAIREGRQEMINQNEGPDPDQIP